MNRNNPNGSEFYPKQLTNFELYALGIPTDNFKTVDTLDDLKKNPPNIIIAECVNRTDSKFKNLKKQSFKSIKFSQNRFSEQELIRGKKYVMASGIYMQLHYDTKNKIEILKPAAIKFKNIYRHYFGQDLSNKTLLIFRQGGIGDLLFIQPNLIYLKEKYPTCTIKIACSPQYEPMVSEWDCVDEVLDLPFEVSELFKADYHCVFEGVIERCKEAESICSYNLFSKWMGLNLDDGLLIPKQKPSSNYEIRERNNNIINSLGLQEKDFIMLQMRASSIIRIPSNEVWKKLIDKITEKGHKILITDSPNKTVDIDNFIKTLENNKLVYNFSQHSRTIADTIYITEKAKLVIGTDSSLTHIAESLEIKSFSIMGPFPGKVRYSTYKHNDWIDVKKEECSPCFIHGSQPCKHSGFNGNSMCYNNLDYDLCIDKIERLLNV